MDEEEYRRREVKQYLKLLRINPERTDEELMHLLAVDESELDEIRWAALNA